MRIHECYYHLQGRDDFVTKKHTHDEIELIECVSGEGTVLKNDRSYPLKKGHLYVIDARCPHIVHPSDCDGYIRNKIVIDAALFEHFCEMLSLREAVSRLFSSPPIPTAGYPEIDLLFKKAASLCEGGTDADHGFAMGYVAQILHFAVSHREKTDVISAEQPLEKALSLIAEADGETTLGEISEKLHVNKYYLCHLFKEKTGMTISEYIAEKRYEKSLRLLKDLSLSVENIAFLCGFASASSFTRFFKKKHGASPLQYRKKLDARQT